MPYCERISGKCSFEQDSDPCRERTSSACACGIQASKLSCPVLGQYGRCHLSKSCEGCNRLK